MAVCLLVGLKNDVSKLHDIFLTCYLWPWLGPPLTTVHYVYDVMYFRFSGCVMLPVMGYMTDG